MLPHLPPHSAISHPEHIIALKKNKKFKGETLKSQRRDESQAAGGAHVLMIFWQRGS